MPEETNAPRIVSTREVYEAALVLKHVIESLTDPATLPEHLEMQYRIACEEIDKAQKFYSFKPIEF